MAKLLFRKKKEPKDIEYTDGAEGMILWCNERVCVPIYPEGSDVPVWTLMGELPDTPSRKTGKSYKQMWEAQQKILRKCLKMVNKRFVYRQIVFCWMRGEGKSLGACLIQMWRFFNFPKMLITLGANSRDQVKFVHFDIISDVIRNSPDLFEKIGGERNLREKEIRLRNEKDQIVSTIRSISSFTGIVSNITGYTFSEIFDMKNPKFYVQLDGSIRAIPNALGVIDSTVSDKLHVLYQLYTGFVTGKTKLVFFSHRMSKTGDIEDYWNPNMDAEQLADYEFKFPFGEYERYFLNTWSAGSKRVFTDEMVEEIGFLGADSILLNHHTIKEILEKKNRLIEVMSDAEGKGWADGAEETQLKIEGMYGRLKPVENAYTLKTSYNAPRMATIEDLALLSEMFDTNFAIIAGYDFGDPYAIRGYARTIFTLYAKGLPGSKSKPFAMVTPETSPKYIYFVLNVAHIEDHSLDTVKQELERAHGEFDGVNVLCGERYGAWDAAKWCEERDIKFEPIFPTYDRQKEAFKVVLQVVKEGLLKCPGLVVPGSKSEDILKEELPIFDHDAEKKWFGSPEKLQKNGIQDDFIFSSGWALYGGRMLGVDDFRERKGVVSFGVYQGAEGLLGTYA